ncbi:MAG: hypothetical protein Q9227_002836 [Pyrenula ochraceoflavens]
MPHSVALASAWLSEVSQLATCSRAAPKSRNSLRCSNTYHGYRSHDLTPRRSLFTNTSPRAATQAATAPSPSSQPTPSPQSRPPPPPPPPSSSSATPTSKTPTRPLNSTTGLSDAPPSTLTLSEDDPTAVDWTRSFHGLSAQPFSKEAAAVLLAPITEEDVEIKPDGILYLPEIKYRRILNRAFGPGGWGLAPRGESIVTPKTVTREYALVVHGRLVSIARGEQDYFTPDGIPTASEGCKSNAMMRCCKDLGVASELWDPRWLRTFKGKYSREAFVEHVVSKKRTKIWLRKGDAVQYPYKETK